MLAINNLDEYLTSYGPLLGEIAKRSLAPLHDPAIHKPMPFDLNRAPYDPQAHLITAAVKQLNRDTAVLISGECGSGKTLMAMATVHAHAAGKPYRAIVMAPPQLPAKWEREVRETIPGVNVVQIRLLSDLLHLDRHSFPAGPEFWIISETTAKDGAAFSPAYNKRTTDGYLLRCPSCGKVVMDHKDNPFEPEHLALRRMTCDGSEANPGCGSPLWQYNGMTGKWAPAEYIHKKLPGFFRYFIADELHEEKSPTSARGNALGSIAAGCRFFIGCTGTLFGGYAWHLRTILLRVAPQSLIREGFGWSDVQAFNEVYGRIEIKINEKEPGPSAENKQSKGSVTRTPKVQPGIMPSLFGRHLMDKTVFMSLGDMSDNLPEFKEQVIPVTMDRQLAEAYKEVEDDLRNALKDMLIKGDRRLLGAMLSTLMAYPDHPYDWKEVGYWNTVGVKPRQRKVLVPVTQPRNLPYETVRPKEQELFDLVLREYEQGRQCWVYTTMTGERDVADMLSGMFRTAGLNAKVLRASVSTRKREQWIDENGPGTDVMVSHPQPVRTGLDLFGRDGAHNFTSLIFFIPTFDVFTLRQAARRAWRLGQWQECRCFYLYYVGTMQERAMSLMGKKLTASEAIEGKFSTEGLAAMSGDEGSMEMALARSLVNQLGGIDAAKDWAKITAESFGNRNLSRESRRQVLENVQFTGDQLGLFAC